MRINIEKLKARGIEVSVTDEHIDFYNVINDFTPITRMVDAYGFTSEMVKELVIGAAALALNQATILECME